MATRSRVSWKMGVAGAALVSALLAGPSHAQILDGERSETTGSTTTTSTTLLPDPVGGSSTTTTTTTTTTTPSSATSAPPTTSAPPADAPAPADRESPSSPPAPAAEDHDGDGGQVTWGTVPPEAQKVIDSVVRTAPNSSQGLHDAVQRLVDLGLSAEESVRVGFGRFPVAGVARYSHDWLFPRYGPGFRFHHGTDVFAPFGTPLRAVADGTVTASSSTLGGLSVKVHTDDGTYFYYAHLSALPDGFENGMAVETGDIVGYVGDSGNAKGGSPHVHFGVYPQGGEATDPKPLLDQFLADAMAQLPAIVAQYEARTPPGGDESLERPRRPRSLLATSLLRPLTERTASADVMTEILYQTSANPTSGGASVAQAEAAALAGSIDWEVWQTRADLGRDLLRRTEAVLRLALGERSRTGGVTERAGSP